MSKTVWITGASGGLGQELAIKAAKEKYDVVLLARNTEKLTYVQKEIEKIGGIATCYFLDLTNELTVEEQVRHIFAEVGEVDVLINNAGFGLFEEVATTEMNTITSMFSVNVISLIALTKAVLPHMIAKNNGHIINISSQAGKVATPKAAIYGATKHAVLGFTNGLRLELDETNIHVSSVNPGPIKTPFFKRADQSGTYEKSIERWLLDPERVAKVTIDLIKSPKREVNLPNWMALSTKIYQLMPRLFERIAKKQFQRK